jgi:hypothetical protein
VVILSWAEGVKMFGKYDYYLICREKIVRDFFFVSRVFLLKRRVGETVNSLSG